MTTRDLGETGVRLIGVYFAASSVLGIVRVVASLAMPPIEGFPSNGEIAVLSALPIVGLLAVAAACLFGAQSVAARVFAEHEFVLGEVSRQDLLMVGVALLGVSTVVSGLPGIIQFVGRAVWYAEGSRQSSFLPAMAQSWQPLTNNVLEIVVGAVLAARAGRLAAALDDRYAHTEGG
jgi:hypothetical protein